MPFPHGNPQDSTSKGANLAGSGKFSRSTERGGELRHLFILRNRATVTGLSGPGAPIACQRRLRSEGWRAEFV